MQCPFGEALSWKTFTLLPRVHELQHSGVKWRRQPLPLKRVRLKYDPLKANRRKGYDCQIHQRRGRNKSVYAIQCIQHRSCIKHNRKSASLSIEL
jgi:hypothetical protein